MKIPLSWIKDFVDIDIPLPELAYLMTVAGLEVEEIHFVGLPVPEVAGHGEMRLATKITGFGWEPDKIVVGAVYEVMPHPDADRLVLCRLDDGQQVHIVLTGAPNLHPYRGLGPLPKPIKVAYAREGATIMDAYSPGNQTTVLKRKKIRGVESYSMACSERELGISEEHEGIIFLDDDAPTGMSLVEYMGDAVLDIALTPNIARTANVWGVAREIAAITGKSLRQPDLSVKMEGAPVEGRVSIRIAEPELNPRFVLGLIEGVTIRPSPYEIRRRLSLAGMRPINNIVDATNYAMLEVGEPLHAFDYSVLQQRAGGQAPQINTRRAAQGEQLRTLDGQERKLDHFTVLVCDQQGPLALAGVMGGQESEVTADTVNVLLEGAAWNMINTRRTVMAQKLPSEAAYRFSRGVHPAMAERGVRRGLELMRQWGGGKVAQGLVDEYPLPPTPSRVAITPSDVRRWLGLDLPVEKIAEILNRLEFITEIQGNTVTATAPDHRLDIETGVVGKADVMEEIARVYGYQNILETRLADALPPQLSNPVLDLEERTRDVLVGAGLQEIITYRMTTPEREALLLPPGALADERPYVRLANPITQERIVMRKRLLASVLDIVEYNARIMERVALFEVGPEFHAVEGQELPDEPFKLVVALGGPRALHGWQAADRAQMDFYDLKGVVTALCDGLHIPSVSFAPAEHASMHPGKCAEVRSGKTILGWFGELHPEVAGRYDLPAEALYVAEFDMPALLAVAPRLFSTDPVPAFPPVLEDLALVVDAGLPAAAVEALIRQTGGALVTQVRLFDVYQGGQVPEGKKSLAYSLTYQADRTLTDTEVTKVRQRIIRRLEGELGVVLRR